MLQKLKGGATILTLILALSIIGALPRAASTSSVAKSGCQSQCGNLTIPYPFGIGSSDCFYNQWFQIFCYNDRPYLRINPYRIELINEVLGISIEPENVIIRNNVSNMRVCEGKRKLPGLNRTDGPFRFFMSMTKFMFFGCGTARISFGNDGFLFGCTSVCDGREDTYGCYGINCCQDQTLPDSSLYTSNYNIEISNSLGGNNNCASGFLVDKDWYPQNTSFFLDPSADLSGVEVPVELNWRITKSMPGPGFGNNKNCKLFGDRWFCGCSCRSSSNSNPYIHGCKDHFPDCAGEFLKKNLTSIIIGGISLLISVLVGAIYLLYKITRRRIEIKQKEKIFKRNGGLLLQRYLSSNQNIMEKVRLFTGKDMNKATDHFNENRVLGRGGQGTVYKGMLHDGKIVAIKKSKLLVTANQVQDFINEIIILSQIDHRNVVKLCGCCLEMDVPLLVYEFIPNGTLYNLIHSEDTDILLSWEVRLRISLEVAEALAYLHSATSTPIYHRDIKSSNILLDEKFKAKVSDFGTSRNISIDQTHLTTLVKGTFGYLDPEYFQSSQFTEKSDVYSFGVVLVELLTGLKPICYSEEEESHLNLAGRFLLAMESNCVDEILDPQVKETSNEEERRAIIRLSQQCLNVNGRNRPSMKDVVMELQGIKLSKKPSIGLVTSYEKSAIKGKEIKLSGVDTSIQYSTSSSDTSPFVSPSF